MHKETCSKSNCSAKRRRRIKIEAGLTIGALLLGPALLALMTPGQLDELPRLCLWSHLLGQPCPACGTLHALCFLAHGELGQAVGCNRNVVVIAPLLVCILIQQLRLLWR